MGRQRPWAVMTLVVGDGCDATSMVYLLGVTLSGFGVRSV